jgi:hypothetical protein
MSSPAERPRSGADLAGFGAIALMVACCAGLPLAIALVSAVGAVAVLGGGGILLAAVAGAAAVAAALRRRRACAIPGSDGCEGREAEADSELPATKHA